MEWDANSSQSLTLTISRFLSNKKMCHIIKQIIDSYNKANEKHSQNVSKRKKKENNEKLHNRLNTIYKIETE